MKKKPEIKEIIINPSHIWKRKKRPYKSWYLWCKSADRYIDNVIIKKSISNINYCRYCGKEIKLEDENIV